MANIISKELYQHLKAQPLEDLDATDREQINDYERAEVNAPSNADVNIATHIHNAVTSNPHTHGYDKEEVDWANDILAQESRYFHLKGGNAKDVYVQPVKRIPDNLVEDNDFKFNWKSVYENTKGEKLRDTEADYDKLKKFIDSHMFELNDPDVDLKKIAYNFRMYDPSKIPSELKTKEEIDAYFKNPWGYFINSEQGDEFKKYLADVRENQRKKEVEKIFDKESNFLVDFGLPVAKEYAKKNYENIDGLSDMAGPLATDFATNLVMMSNKPAAGIVAPVLSNAGQVAFNKEDPLRAGAATIIGAAVNKATPYALNRYSNTLRRGETGAEKEAAAEIIKGVDNAAKKASDVQKRLNEGAVFETSYGYVSPKDKVIYTDLTKGELPEEYSNYTVKTINAVLPFKKGIKDVFSDLRNAKNADGIKDKALQIKGAFDRNGRDIITKEDYAEYLQSKHLLRTWPFTKEAKERKKTREIMQDIMDPEYREKLLSDIHNLKAQGKSYSDLTPNHFRALGYDPKESVGQFISRETPDPLRAYITNMLGRDRFASPLFRVPATLGFDLNAYIEEKSKKKKSKISEIFGK